MPTCETELPAAVSGRADLVRHLWRRRDDLSAVEDAVDQLLDDPHPPLPRQRIVELHGVADAARIRIEEVDRCLELVARWRREAR